MIYLLYISKVYFYSYIYIYNIYIYCKIPLIPPGRIYGQRTNLMDLYSGGLIYGGGLYSGVKSLQFAIC